MDSVFHCTLSFFHTDSSREAFSFPTIISASRSSHAFLKPLLACIVDGGIDSRARWREIDARAFIARGRDRKWGLYLRERETVAAAGNWKISYASEDARWNRSFCPISRRIFFVPTYLRGTAWNKMIQHYNEIFTVHWTIITAIFETL